MGVTANQLGNFVVIDHISKIMSGETPLDRIRDLKKK